MIMTMLILKKDAEEKMTSKTTKLVPIHLRRYLVKVTKKTD